MRIAASAIAPVAVGLVTFLLVLLVWMLAHSSGGVVAAVARGDRPTAPTFSISALHGNAPIDLATYGGRVIVVNFWASWCGPCHAETPALVRAWRRWRSHLVTFIGVDTRDSTGDARAFLRHAQISYPAAATTAPAARRRPTASERYRPRSSSRREDASSQASSEWFPSENSTLRSRALSDAPERPEAPPAGPKRQRS